MRYLLDTNICITLIKQKPLQVLEKFSAYAVGDIGISAITAIAWKSSAGTTSPSRAPPAASTGHAR